MGILPWDTVRLDGASADSRCGQSEPMREPQVVVTTLACRDEAHGYAPPTHAGTFRR